MSTLIPYHKGGPERAYPGELIYMYRIRAGLTQGQLAAFLGLKSHRMVLNWEGGLNLPPAAKLKALLEVLARNRVFVKGGELKEAENLWLAVKEFSDSTSDRQTGYPLMDRVWFEHLLEELDAAPLTMVGENTSSSLLQSNVKAGEQEGLVPLHNLPWSPTSFVGREKEEAEVRDLLLRPEVRLLTLTGSGGTGKTRLALQTAASLLGFSQFRDGIFFVDLSSLASPDLIFFTIETVLRNSQKKLALAADDCSLKERLQNKQILLILDNFEHLLAGGPQVAGLLQLSRHLKMLVTSREKLHIYGEYEYLLSPLQLPVPSNSLGELAGNEAVALFIERATAASPSVKLGPSNLRSVAEICIGLDGLPLAIELVAGQVHRFPPEVLQRKFVLNPGEKLELLTGGPRDVPRRHETLTECLDWSYRLLDQPEKEIFQQLGLFRGSFNPHAAEVVCRLSNGPGGEGEIEPPFLIKILENLTARNFLVLAPPVRYPMEESPADLLEDRRFNFLQIVGEYARKRLGNGPEVSALWNRLLDYYLKLAEAASEGLQGPDQLNWLRFLEAEVANFRAVQDWAMERAEIVNIEKALKATNLLMRFYVLHGNVGEGRMRLENFLARISPQALTPKLLAQTLFTIGLLSQLQNDLEGAYNRFKESLAICEQQSLKVGQAHALSQMGFILMQQDRDYEQALKLYEEALALHVELGNQLGQAVTFNNMGIAARYQKDWEEAERLYRKSLALHQAAGNMGDVAGTLSNLAEIKRFQGNYREAAFLYKDSLGSLKELNYRQNVAEVLRGMAVVEADLERFEKSALLLGAAEVLREEVFSFIPKAEQAEYELQLNLLRQKLGTPAFKQAWNRGRNTPLEDLLEEIFSAGSLWTP